MRKFIHVDMDAFYVSVEIRDQPQLANKPVAVGGKSDSRGVLSTCNYLAREFGVRSAMPSSMAKRLCPNLIIVPGRMHVYRDLSLKIRAIFLRYTHLIEPLSLDEAYLDVTECKLFSGSATLIAQDIRKSIERELGLTASAGIAPLKFVAKIASDMNKPNGQFVVKPDHVETFIASLPLNKIPGVGKVTFAKLQALNLHKGEDVKAFDQGVLMQKFGKFGLSLWRKCHGIDKREVETSRVRKSIAVERTFPENMKTETELRMFLFSQLIPELQKRSAPYLSDRKINKLGIKMKFSDFRQTTKEYKTSELTGDVFLSLLKEAWMRRQNKEARLLGVYVGLSDYTDKAQQLPLSFD